MNDMGAIIYIIHYGGRHQASSRASLQSPAHRGDDNRGETRQVHGGGRRKDDRPHQPLILRHRVQIDKLPQNSPGAQSEGYRVSEEEDPQLHLNLCGDAPHIYG